MTAGCQPDDRLMTSDKTVSKGRGERMAIGRAIEAQPTTAPVTAEWSVSAVGMGAYCLISCPVILIQRGEAN